MSKQKPGVKLTLALFASLMISVGAFTSTATANITIDEYTAGSTIARFTAGTSNQFSFSGDILGGQRNDSLTLRDLGGDQFFGIMGFNGNAQIAQGTLDQVFGSMVYSNFADIDLTDGHENYAFRVSVTGVNSATPLSDVLSITVNDGINTSTVGFDLPGSPDVPTDVHVRFDLFAGIDFTSVDSIELAFDFQTAPGNTISIGGFYAVPEPGQAAFLFVAATAWFGRRRRA